MGLGRGFQNQKQWKGYDDDGKPKIPGTLNKGIGGEHGIDKFNPAGVIQNRKIKYNIPRSKSRIICFQ